MRAVHQGQMKIGDGFSEAMELCLGCLACVTACPAGVQYDHLLESARGQAEIYRKTKRRPIVNRLRHWLLNRFLYNPYGLQKWAPLLRLYQRVGLQRLNLARLLPGDIGSWERMLPSIPSLTVFQTLGKFVPAVPPIRGRVGLLTGCLENTLLSQMAIATARVLSLNGFEVVLPPEQECCGALPAHIGELEIARQRARKNIDVFEAANVEVVISDAAGCSAQLKDYDHLLRYDPDYYDRAQRFAKNVRDATEFLAKHLPLRGDLRKLELRVAYDDPCHLIHGQGIYNQPRSLLESIPGIELVVLPKSSWCCGSAGTYHLTHVHESGEFLKRRIAYLRQVSPDVLTTANTGCYIQLAAGIHSHKLDIKVMHVVELLADSYVIE
jgi:glycolate oxidase iron-sulfur subunit